MRRGLGFLLILLLLIAITLAGLIVLRSPAQPIERASVVDALSADSSTAGFERALAPRPFSFPADHGPHPAFQTEWWYYTGNLDDASGRHFGFQLTFFRRALSANGPARPSDWAANQIYFAHFTVTDVAGHAFYPSERYSRGAAGLAGAQAEPFRIWVENWSASGEVSGTVRLRAADDQAAVDLAVHPLKPVVLQGDHGLSQKSPQPGNASYYYSLTRLQTSGTITVSGQTFSVTGLSWMDREWSTSALSRDDAGWDWFSLQLADGREAMLFQLRRTDGTIEPTSSGSLVAGDGTVRPLRLSDFRIEILDTWTSPQTGARYPSRWRLSIPAANLDVEVTPYLAGQELPLTFAYWEGACQVKGTSAGSAVTGNGYVELTGYANSAQGRY